LTASFVFPPKRRRFWAVLCPAALAEDLFNLSPLAIPDSANVIDVSREMIAYGLIGTVALVATPVIIALVRRRKREKLRRRGIKRYGH
jgi:hypothetical protein